MPYYLVPRALQCHVRQTMQYVVILTRGGYASGSKRCLFIEYIIMAIIEKSVHTGKSV